MATLLFGAPHSGKSTLLKMIAEELLKESPEGMVRVITAETHKAFRKLVEKGQVEIWPVYLRQYPWETLMYAAQGFWPVAPKDPASLLAPPYIKDGCLMTGKYMIKNDKAVFDGEPRRVLACMFEGTTTYGELLLGSAVKGGLAARVGRGEIVGNIKKEIITFLDGKTNIGFNSGIQYGYVQSRVTDYVKASQALPCEVYWSSHQDTGEDRVFNKPVIGPKIVGSAAIDQLPKQFSTVLYLRMVADKDNKPEYRVFIKPFFEIIESQDWDGKRHTDRVPVYANLRPDAEDVDKIPTYIKADEKGVEQLKKLIKLFSE